MANPMRRTFLRGLLAVPIAMASPLARACEYFTATLRIEHPWTRATAPGATTAAVFMTLDEVTEDDRLVGVETPIADAARTTGDGADGVCTLRITRGAALTMDETTPHVLLTGLRHALELGRSYPMTLVFEKGGRVLTTLHVDFPAA